MKATKSTKQIASNPHHAASEPRTEAGAAPAAPAAPPPAQLPIPSEADVTALVDTLEGIRTLLGAAATPMTAQQRRRALRAKKGGELTAGLMAGLGKQYNVQIPGVDPDRIAQHSLLVQRLQPLETKLRVVTGLVSDTVANAKAESWEGTTSLYTALARASRRNAALQKELKPAVAFFKTKKANGNAPVVAAKKPPKGKTATAGAPDAPPPTPDASAGPSPTPPPPAHDAPTS